MVMLGEQPGYRWTINGRAHGEHLPFDVRQGERVEMTFMNPTSMMHPMHLHGHHFQVVAIGGQRIRGAMRDTIIVPAHNPVTVAFDANQKGAWFAVLIALDLLKPVWRAAPAAGGKRVTLLKGRRHFMKGQRRNYDNHKQGLASGKQDAASPYRR